MTHNSLNRIIKTAMPRILFNGPSGMFAERMNMRTYPDGKSISDHETRTYTYAGERYVLDKGVEGSNPIYSLTKWVKGSSLGDRVKIQGKDHWGVGLEWDKAEDLMVRELTRSAKGPRAP